MSSKSLPSIQNSDCNSQSSSQSSHNSLPQSSHSGHSYQSILPAGVMDDDNAAKTEESIIPTSWKVGMVFCVALAITLIVCTVLASRGTIQIPMDGWEFKALAGATTLVGILQLASIPFFISFYRKESERKASAENLSTDNIIEQLFGPSAPKNTNQPPLNNLEEHSLNGSQILIPDNNDD